MHTPSLPPIEAPVFDEGVHSFHTTQKGDNRSASVKVNRLPQVEDKRTHRPSSTGHRNSTSSRKSSLQASAAVPRNSTSARKSSLLAPAPSPRYSTSSRKSSLQEVPPEDHATSKRGSVRLSKTFTFADCSLDQIRVAINSEDPDFEFDSEFWSTILTESISPGFKILQNRTLTFWIKVFNMLLDLSRKSGKFPDVIDGRQLSQILACGKEQVKQIAFLFDWKRVDKRPSFEVSDANLKDIKVPILDLITAGVVLSRLIATKNKLPFILGLADVDDTGSLDENEFAKFLGCFIRGLGAAFGVPPDTIPAREETDTVATKLYKRIGTIKAHRVRALVAKHGREVNKAVRDVIKLKQAGTWHSMPGAARGQILPYDTICEWCLGVISNSDPLALPYRLTFDRFCPSRFNDIPDEFDDQIIGLRLSHTSRVPVPKDAEMDVKKCCTTMLTRPEVLFAWDLFRFCQRIKNFKLPGVDLKSIEAQLSQDWALERNVKLRIIRSLRLLVEGHDATPFEFVDFLRQLCPGAWPKHLRMFEVWCMRYDELMETRKATEQLSKTADDFFKDEHKPLLPDDEIKLLKEEFQRLDRQGNGFISMRDIEQGWNWDKQMSEATVDLFDFAADGYIDIHEFLVMMCPRNKRLPDVFGFGRELFGNFLVAEMEAQEAAYSLEMSRNGANADSPQRTVSKTTPRAVLPILDDNRWLKWNEVFDRLDTDKNNNISIKELLSSGLMDQSACETIASWIDPEDKTGFTRDGFLEAMLKAHGCRRPLDIDFQIS